MIPREKNRPNHSLNLAYLWMATQNRKKENGAKYFFGFLQPFLLISFCEKKTWIFNILKSLFESEKIIQLPIPNISILIFYKIIQPQPNYCFSKLCQRFKKVNPPLNLSSKSYALIPEKCSLSVNFIYLTSIFFLEISIFFLKKGMTFLRKRPIFYNF